MNLFIRKWRVAIPFLMLLGASIVLFHGGTVRPDHGLTPLMRSIVGNDLQTVNSLIDSGVDLNAKDEWGNVALCYALSKNNYEIVNKLIAHGADPHIKGTNGMALSNYAAMQNQIDLKIWELLIHCGVDINARNPLTYGATPLHEVIMRYRGSRYDEIKFLLKHGANPNIADFRGQTVYDFVKESNDPILINLLAD